MTAVQPYIPRHAGETPEAKRRSRARRAQVDLDRAMRLLDQRWQAGDFDALRLQVKLANPRTMRELVSA